LNSCKNIQDFIPISKLEGLEILYVGDTNISDISFLEKNKNIKELNLNSYENIKDFTPIFKLERLQYVNNNFKNIFVNSVLEKIKILKN